MGVCFGPIFKDHCRLAQRDSISSNSGSPSGAILLLPTKDRSEAYQHLDDLLKSVTSTVDRMEDLLYLRSTGRETAPSALDSASIASQRGMRSTSFASSFKITAEQVSEAGSELQPP